MISGGRRLLIPIHQTSYIFSKSSPITSHIGSLKTVAGIRFHQSPAGTPDSSNKMETTQNPTTQNGDVMSHSFGEGYATRSDEEGFGGTVSESQSLPKGEQDKIVHGNSPEYDKSQGSEVKEKETARHQTSTN